MLSRSQKRLTDQKRQSEHTRVGEHITNSAVKRRYTTRRNGGKHNAGAISVEILTGQYPPFVISDRRNAVASRVPMRLASARWDGRADATDVILA